MSYETTRGGPANEAYEAKVPASIDTKSLLTKLTDAFKKLRKTDGDRDR
jgi:hypothetical protein